MRTRSPFLWLLAIPVFCLLTAAAYNLPPIHERLAWRLESLLTKVRYTIHPPEQVVFVPQEQQEQVKAIVQATLQALLPSITPILPSMTPSPALPGATGTPLPSPTPTVPPTPIPGKVILKGIRHEYQQLNNCGPTTLAMALSYWGWQGDQRDTRAYLRPNFKDFDDKNVMPSEMVAFVETQTNLKALARVAGDLELIKRFIAAGFPVIIEKGLQQHPRDWMGHYALVSGFDDGRQRFITQDSFIMPDLPVPYEEVEAHWWRDFNYAYIVIYPPERENEVAAVLGPHTDTAYNEHYAAQKAEQEATQLSGRDLYFAWYNLGSSRVALQDYAGAAEAYDRAFAIYPSISEEDRPWRMLWYQIGPYPAYYYTGRYQDVITLGNQTLNSAGKPVLEESFFWLGMAREAEGDLDKAVYDYQKAAEINPSSTPAQEQLRRLGAVIP